MFTHSFKNTLKTLVRQKALIFWGLIFPIALGIMFKLALGNIDNESMFQAIPISINENLMDQPFFSSFIDELEKEEIFIVHEVSSDQLLKDKEVLAYVESMDSIITGGSGIKETIIETIFNSYKHNEATAIRIMSENPQTNISEILINKERIIDQSNPNMNMLNTYFYTLIGMQAMYGYMWGMAVIYQYEANLSTTAKRNTVAPTNKFTQLIASLLVAWLINMVVILITMAFVQYGLGVNLGDKIGHIFGLVSLAGLTGVSFGTLLGVSNKKSLDFKIGLGISLTMTMSFLAGMMVAQMKVIIQKAAPIINQINPVALITDSMYSLYYYPNYDRYFMNMMWLGGVTLVFIAATLFFMGGKQYDSL